MPADDRHLPSPASIDAYGNGGFRFGGLSHRGSILCLPAGIWAWPVTEPSQIDERSLARVLAAADELDFLLIGTGRELWRPPERLLARFRAKHLSVDAMQTGPAVRTYNVTFVERRRVAAALIAVA